MLSDVVEEAADVAPRKDREAALAVADAVGDVGGAVHDVEAGHEGHAAAALGVGRREPPRAPGRVREVRRRVALVEPGRLL